MKMTRRAGAATIELVPDDGGLDLAVSYDLGNGTWIGIASFPWELEDEALLWLERIRSAADLEDLFREWSPEETWVDFQAIRDMVDA